MRNHRHADKMNDSETGQLQLQNHSSFRAGSPHCYVSPLIVQNWPAHLERKFYVTKTVSQRTIPRLYRKVASATHTTRTARSVACENTKQPNLGQKTNLVFALGYPCCCCYPPQPTAAAQMLYGNYFRAPFFPPESC